VLVTVSLAMIARLPVPGTYSVDLLGPFVINGIGFAHCFIPVTIAGLAGVAPAQAGAASGLLNTSRQVGGAVGLAVVNTIAAGSVSESAEGLAHGFRVSLLVLAGMALLGAVLSSTLLAPSPERATVPLVEEPVREAA
jgi:MFS family permease